MSYPHEIMDAAKQVLKLRTKWPWPEEAKEENAVTGYPTYDKEDRCEYDTIRCGPVLWLKANGRKKQWQWCNKGFGKMGHINNGGEYKKSVNTGYCYHCGEEL